ncbi:WW domain-containing oxidoreductase-like protein [Umbelopsis sp. PMI_123]|nr:WW domain-containing oxidoreductase-like protein [Umbelopsis sp. PMI_123]
MFEEAIKALSAPVIETEGYHWTTDYVLDLLPKSASVQGKTYIITAGHTGIGEETTRALISRGANVIIGARNKEMAEASISRFKETYPHANVKWIYLDLSDLPTVRQFAIDFKELDVPLHGIVCSAGIMCLPYLLSKQGHEMQFATNHLGHHLLLVLLVDKLVKSHGRIVTVSSGGYVLSGVRFDDLKFKNGEEYNEFTAYGQSKTANILCSKGFNQLYAKDGVECFSVHPGVVPGGRSGSGISERALKAIQDAHVRSQSGFKLKTRAEGAATQLYALTSPDLNGKGGAFLFDCHIAEPTIAEAADVDGIYARRLFDLSQELVKEYLD